MSSNARRVFVCVQYTGARCFYYSDKRQIQARYTDGAQREHSGSVKTAAKPNNALMVGIGFDAANEANRMKRVLLFTLAFQWNMPFTKMYSVAGSQYNARGNTVTRGVTHIRGSCT